MSESVEETVRNTVVQMFLETGHDSTIREIASQMKCSESKVQKALVHDGLVIYGVERSQHVRDSRSANYKHMVSGVHRVTAYGPTREYLRTLINGRAT